MHTSVYPQRTQSTLYVIHEFGEIAVKFNFITTLLVTKFRGTRSPVGPLIYKSWSGLVQWIP